MNKKFILALLFSFIAFLVFSNYIFMQHYDIFAWKDTAYHGSQCARMYQVLKGDHSETFIEALISEPSYTPLYYLVSAVVRLIAGYQYVFMTSSLFLILLLYGAYKIGEYVKDSATGLLSAVIIGLYPIIYASSRVLDLELAQTAMSVWIFYFLIRNNKFYSLAYALFFGVLMAAALLVKQSIVFFAVGPLCAVFCYFLGPAATNKVRLKNLFIALSVAMVLAVLIYYRRYLMHPADLTNDSGVGRLFMGNEENLKVANPYHPRYLIFHLLALKKYHIGAANIVFFIIALFYFIRCHKDRRQKQLFLLWFGVPLIIFTVITSRFFQYTIPCVPFLGIVTAVGFSYMRPRFLKRTLISVFVIWNAFMFIRYNDVLFPGTENFIMGSRAGWQIRRYMEIDCGVFPQKKMNPFYAAAAYLNEAGRGKDYSVGIIYYPTDDIPPQAGFYLAMLLQLHNTRAMVMDLIRYWPWDSFPHCDFFVFVRSVNRKEKWIDYDAFSRDIVEANKLNFHCSEKFVMVDKINMSTNGVTYISRKMLKNLVDCLPKFKLAEVISGNDKEVLIYSNVRERARRNKI